MSGDAMNAGVRYSRDRPKSCEFCYYWKGRPAGSTKENLVQILVVISKRMEQQGQLIAAVEPSQAVFDLFDPSHLKVGDTITAQENLHFRLRKIQTKDGREWLAAFTSDEEVRKGESTSTLAISMKDHLEAILDMDNVAGVIINPWGQSFLMDKELIRILFQAKEENRSNTPMQA